MVFLLSSSGSSPQAWGGRRYYDQSQEGNLILRAGWLLEVAECAERILERVDEELQQVRAEMGEGAAP